MKFRIYVNLLPYNFLRLFSGRFWLRAGLILISGTLLLCIFCSLILSITIKVFNTFSFLTGEEIRFIMRIITIFSSHWTDLFPFADVIGMQIRVGMFNTSIDGWDFGWILSWFGCILFFVVVIEFGPDCS